MSEISKRNIITYTEIQKYIYEQEKLQVMAGINIGIAKGNSPIYENQKYIGQTITSEFFKRNIILIMIIALTQSGKTGTMVALIKYYLHSLENVIPIENIYIITGLSSKAWKIQTKDRMPVIIENRVFHRNEIIKKFENEIKNKQNILIICDEIQIAAKENQTLAKSFEKAGFYDKTYLFENDIKIVEFSATPDGTIYDLMNWGDNAAKIKMEPGDNYTSSFNLLASGRVKQYKDLCLFNKVTGKCDNERTDEHITEIKKDIDKFNTPLYHIIRTQSGALGSEVIKNFKRIFKENAKYIEFNGESEIVNINDYLIKKPDENTFIFIKEKLRCAITFEKKHLGILYERYTKKPDDAVIIQSLLGRNTGYNDNDFSIVYTNIPSINKYKKLWDSDFNDKTVNWCSKTTKYSGKTRSNGTFQNPSLINGMNNENKDIKIEPEIKIFKTQTLAKQYYNKELKETFKGSGPRKRKENEDGFYEATIKKEKKIWSCDELKNSSTYKGCANNKYWFYPCYKNIKDKSTVEWWLIFYNKYM
jgi:hypothetical protein